MMLSKSFVRYFHIQTQCWAAAKSQLANLRKKTGYTFANCKKALELHNNDILEAEKWLIQQAQTLGWSKAMKLEGRQTTQGLIAVAINNNNAALVEINCETDFVAKNQTFQEMAETTAQACLKYLENQPLAQKPMTKISLDAEQLRQLSTTNGKSLADQLALMIGSLGENATLRRATCVKIDDNVHISGYAHPSGVEKNDVLIGRYGGLVVLKQKESKDVDIKELGKKICQHVVGMRPTKIGTESDQPAKNIDDEPCLIYQEFINDETVTVKDILEENSVEVIDFNRYECGEHFANIQPLSTVKTCQ